MDERGLGADDYLLILVPAVSVQGEASSGGSVSVEYWRRDWTNGSLQGAEVLTRDLDGPIGDTSLRLIDSGVALDYSAGASFEIPLASELGTYRSAVDN